MRIYGVGQDVTNLGASKFARTYTAIPEAKFDAIVEDIVTNETGGTSLTYKTDGSNVGEIRYRVISEDGSNDRNIEIKDLPRALPINLNFMTFPLVGERVIIHQSPGDNVNSFYSLTLNTSNKVTDNLSVFSTILTRRVNPEEATQTRQLEELQIEQPIPANNRIDTFIAGVSTRHIRASAGDSIIQGRYGNTIRLGSSLFKNPNTSAEISPNIILTAGQWETPTEISTAQETPYSSYFENLDNDKSSIWMVANQVVPFRPATAMSTSKEKADKRSSEMTETKYTGAQIFINSDRVILNSKKNEISLFSKTEINLSAIKSITVDTESSVIITANRNIDIKADKNLILRGKQISIISTGDLSYKTTGTYAIEGNKIFIGRYADTSQPMVLGATLSLWLNSFLTLLFTPGALQTATGPVLINPGTLAGINELKRQLGDIKTPQQAVFNSKDNFTSEFNPS